MAGRTIESSLCFVPACQPTPLRYVAQASPSSRLHSRPDDVEGSLVIKGFAKPSSLSTYILCMPHKYKDAAKMSNIRDTFEIYRMLSIHLGVMTLSAFPMETLGLCDEAMQVKAMARFTSEAAGFARHSADKSPGDLALIV